MALELSRLPPNAIGEASRSAARSFVVVPLQSDDLQRGFVRGLHERYPDLKPILVEDALYANAPHLRQITGYGWLFVLNVKPDSHESLERQFARRRASG